MTGAAVRRYPRAMDGSTKVDYGAEEAAMQAYLRAGEQRAASLGNRGPIRFTDKG